MSLVVAASAASFSAGAKICGSAKTAKSVSLSCSGVKCGIDINSLFKNFSGLCIGGKCTVITPRKNTQKTSEPKTEPTQKPTAKPTQPATKATEPTQKPTQSATKATEPTQKPTQPATKATEPTQKPTQSATKATEPPTKPAEAEFNSAYEDEVIRLVNIERQSYGLSPLSKNAAAVSAARIRAKEITLSFSHTRPNGTSCFTAAGEAGLTYRTAGENIAYGYPSPKQVVTGWMNSDGHRKNILSASFSGIGVGCYSKGGVIYWSQFFVG